jgi:hypothetical protein
MINVLIKGMAFNNEEKLILNVLESLETLFILDIKH